MNGKFSKIGKCILALCELAVGVLLLISPVGFTSAIIKVLGALLLVVGIISILRYSRTLPIEAAREQSLTQGLLQVIAGLFCLFNSGWFIATFPLLTVLYGVIALVIGVAKIQWSVDLLRMKSQKWFWAAISAAVTLIGAIIILANPFASSAAVWIFVAINLIVDAVLDTLTVIFTKN